MQRWLRVLIDFLKKEDGPSAVEYAVMLGMIIVVCIAAITVIGTKTSANFNSPEISKALGS